MYNNVKQLEGLTMKYNSWTLIKRTEGQKALFRCDCGFEAERHMGNITSGRTKKCTTCYAKSRVLDFSIRATRQYRIWADMKGRCYNKKNNSYVNYGARGITVCDEWINDARAFYDWSLENGYSDDLTIDRIDNDKEYSPNNCRWTTKTVQAQNTRLIRKGNKSGYRGVNYHRGDKKYSARCTNNGKRVYLGGFDTAEEGARAYDKYVIDNKLSQPLNFGWTRYKD